MERHQRKSSNMIPSGDSSMVVAVILPPRFKTWLTYEQVLCYYLAYILKTYLNFSTQMSLILASVAFTQYAIFSWPPFFYIDRIGRRWTVMLSSAGCAICMFVIAGCLLKASYGNAAAATAFMFLYMDCFTMGILPVSWSYSAEIQPLRVRNKSMAVGVFSHWLSNVRCCYTSAMDN